MSKNSCALKKKTRYLQRFISILYQLIHKEAQNTARQQAAVFFSKILIKIFSDYSLPALYYTVCDKKKIGLTIGPYYKLDFTNNRLIWYLF